VFLNRRARRRAQINQRWTPPAAAPHPGPFDEWQRAAQRVRRAWNAWLAADGQQRRVWYGAFVQALAEEERAAAEVERLTKREVAGG
jgi:hypothetical protein